MPFSLGSFWTSPARSAPAAVAVFFALIYSVYGLFRHWQFGSSAFDLGIFDQAVWHMSRFRAPASTISGFSNILGDHFYPIIAAFVPLYWIAPAPETLIVAQAVLIAASIVPVCLYLRTRLDPGPALTLAAAYGFFWGLQRAVAFDVHEVAFAPLIIGTLILAMDQRRWGLFWTMALLLMLVKEDLIPVLTFAGLYLVILGEKRRGAALILLSLSAFIVIVRLVIPALSDAGQYAYRGAYEEVLRRPWTIPQMLVTPPVKLTTALLWLAPFALLPLRSPLALLVVPFVVSRFLSDSPMHWGTSFHYSAPLAPILAMSAGDGLARLSAAFTSAAARARFTRAAAALCFLLSLFLPGNQPFWDLFKARHYQRTAVHEAGMRAVQLIPPEASVAAQAAIVPHLSQRPDIVILDERPIRAEYVVAADALSPWPLASSQGLRARVEELRAMNYRIVFEEHGWRVLRRRQTGALEAR